MQDILLIRNNPEHFDAALARRGIAPQAASILALDQEARKKQTQLQQLQQDANSCAKEIGARKAKGEDATELLERSKALKAAILQAKAEQSDSDEGEVQGAVRERLLTLPNLPAADVPDGVDEHGNKEIRRVGAVPEFSFTASAHDVLGVNLGLMDFDVAANLSGSRFVFLRGALARLERALANFMLDLHTREFGYVECNVPLLVRSETMLGVGQLPKFSEEAFQTTNGYWLIPTSEVSLVGAAAQRIFSEAELPLRLTALTPCFRSEAGAAGRDTRGMIRQHQFNKVELVSITTEEQAKEEHERMLNAAETVLARLELPYRVMLLCAGDMGFCAQKTYDIEVWLPGQNAYREISSCSNCGDFQGRRMQARVRDAAGKIRPVHTLNGSGLAVGRTLVAIMENYQNADGSINIPAVLQPFMGGASKIISEA
jgi:seryl-tRNA synthetase